MKNIVVFMLVLVISGCTTVGRSIEGQAVSRKSEEKNMMNGKTPTQDMKKRVLVLPFLLEVPGAPAEINREAQSEFINELNRTGEMLALNSSELGNINATLKNSEYDFKTLAAMGGKLGVTGFLEGKILEIKAVRTSPEVGIFRKVRTQYVCKVRVRMGSARSGKELFNTVKTVTLEENSTRVGDSPRFGTDMLNENPELIKQIIKDAFKEFLPQIIDVMERQNWEGRIAAIQGERIYLNVGSISGLQIGDLLKVMDDGQEVYDPETGAFIGQVPGKLKGTLEVITFFGQDASIAIIHSGAGFKENDRVELY